MGGAVPKQFLSLGGLPILVYSLRILTSLPVIAEIVVLVPEADRQYCQTQIIDHYGFGPAVRVVDGGPRRQDSVGRGLAAIREVPDFVLVHDGVRPFLTRMMVERVLRAARDTGAAVAGIPMNDTVKRVSPQGTVVETLNREELWIIQTPQVFRYEWLEEGHRLAVAQGWEVTDDAALIERIGHPIRVVLGSPHNVKITTPEDLALGEALLRFTEHV